MARQMLRFVALILFIGLPAAAQTPITSPQQHFGNNIGDDYFLVNYTQMLGYGRRSIRSRTA